MVEQDADAFRGDLGSDRRRGAAAGGCGAGGSAREVADYEQRAARMAQAFKPPPRALDDALTAGTPRLALDGLDGDDVLARGEAGPDRSTSPALSIVDSRLDRGRHGAVDPPRRTPRRDRALQAPPDDKVFTDDGREVAPGSGEIGLVANGGMVPLGYYKDRRSRRGRSAR